MGTSRSASQLIADSAGLLLDFDGPVCDVYAGADPSAIAQDVAAAFELDIDTTDPLELISHALATGGPVDEIHQALAATEVAAVQTATETPGARQLIENYHSPIAIVSNNASQAIEAWLRKAGLESQVDVVTGRDPRRMKPNPWPLEISARAIDRQIDRCVFIGDSLSDFQAALNAGSPVIALANKPNKTAAFEDAGCTTIVQSLLGLQHQTSEADQAI